MLETKITVPRVRAEHVPRRELLAAMHDDGPRRLTLVAAPPGFGKTTLLAEWAAHREGAIAWLSLDADDNDPTRFFGYVDTALRRAEPTLGTRAAAAARSPGAGLADVVLPLFLNDLAAIDRDLVLVLDDYQAITNAEIHEVLSSLIERAPRTFHVAIATREDPPFPLGGLRAKGELAEVRAGDLRFGDDEATTFLTGSLSLELSAQDVARLQTRTEGWPAALYLAALSLRGRPDPSALIDRFAGDDRYVVDYLTAEVLARQPSELRSFLLRTSILRRLCGPLCDAILDREGSAELLAEIERSNLLLVPLDTTREWYRYHHLFGELLRHELSSTDADDVAELHRRASAWYREAGLIVEAADHATAAGDVDAAVALVAGHYADFVHQGQLATVLRWIDVLPESVAARDPLACFAAGVVTAHGGRLDEAEHWLELGEHAAERGPDRPEATAALASLAGALRLLRGDIGGAVEHARLALEHADASDPMTLGPRMVLASGLWWSGDVGEAKVVLDAATRTAKAAGIAVNIVYALGVRAAVALEDQDEPAAQALADEAIELMRRAELDEHPWVAMTHITHGALEARRGDPARAAGEIERGIALGERLGAWQVIAHGSLVLAEVRQRLHEPTAARRLLTRVRDLLTSLPDPGDGLERLARTEKLLRLHPERREAEGAYWELSQRELDVLRLLPTRLSQREIASELYVSFNTVRTHVRVIFRKLGVTSRAEAVARARELGLL